MWGNTERRNKEGKKKAEKANSNDKVLAGRGNKSQHICQKLQQRIMQTGKIKKVTLNAVLGIHFPVICDKLLGSKRMVTIT